MVHGRLRIGESRDLSGSVVGLGHRDVHRIEVDGPFRSVVLLRFRCSNESPTRDSCPN